MSATERRPGDRPTELATEISYGDRLRMSARQVGYGSTATEVRLRMRTTDVASGSRRRVIATDLRNGAPPRAWLRSTAMLSNKGMKQTSAEHNGRSQLIPGVGQTVAGGAGRGFVLRA